MHFGIKSAPEAFQRRIYEVVEGLSGVEVVADDFMVVGFGEMEANARGNHNEQLEVFLQRCKEKDLQLNDKKFKLCQPEVPFIGHVVKRLLTNSHESEQSEFQVLLDWHKYTY